jgi:TolB-like protein/DNA-binding winged helix-turn-helix (wHTH) protein/Tfp pilus assembly protein PilF
MVPQAGTTNTQDLIPDPAGYQVDDLSIDLAPRRVRRAGTVIRLQALSFDLLVTLVRAAPNLVSYEQLSEWVWPGLVVTPETIVQRVKLLRSALGDDPRAPRYIEGVRGRGYRMIAQVRPVAEPLSVPESVMPPSLKETKEEERPNVETGFAKGAGAVTSPSPTPPAPPGTARWVPQGWIGGTLIIVALITASWAVVRYRGASNPNERTSSGAGAVIHSLAVLPLENLSGDKEQEYFADGMTDTLITNLAQVGSLRVISRTSVMRFKGSKESLPQIGRDLQVDAVVEGTVTRSAGRVRISAQLIEASKDHHLWARSYERDLKDVLALQDEIARDITEQIRVELTPNERNLLMQVHTVDPEAQDAYLRGRYWNSEMTADAARKGLDYSRKAVAKDPSYALAYAGVAHSFQILRITGALPWHEAFAKQKEAAIRALELDPSLAEAHVSLAQVRFGYDWDWSGAEDEFKQAIALKPNDALAHGSYAGYLLAMERLDEAAKESERARDLDPFSAQVNWWVGQLLYHARRYDDALRQNRRGLEMYPDNAALYDAMADVYEQTKSFAEAFAARSQALKLRKDPTSATLDEAYKRFGYSGYLRRKVAILEQTPQLQIDAAEIAHQYALLDDEPHAMTWLERAYDERNGKVLFLRTAPELDSIRSSTRFRDLVSRIGFPQPSRDKN